MLRDLKIHYKFPLVMICFALLSAIVTGGVAYRQATSAIEGAVSNKLISLLESRAASLRRHFGDIENDLLFHVQSDLVTRALKEFSAAWDTLGENKQHYLKTHYVDRDPITIGQEFSLLAAEDGSVYSEVHRRFHSSFLSLIHTTNYYDSFLISAKGDIVYSALKESDFATNVTTNPDTAALGNLFDQLVHSGGRLGQRWIKTGFSDFVSYTPSDRKIAGFVAAPVFDAEAKLLGLLAFQISIEPINAIMQVTAGMGETGETYLVGPDTMMRSDSRFLGNSLLSKSVDTVSVAQALTGFDGVQLVDDYRGVPVLSAYAPIDILGITWVILAEMDEQEVLSPVKQMNVYLSISGIAIATAIATIGFYLATDLSQPIVTMTNVMKRLAMNDLGVNVPVVTRKDEIGQMASALTEFKAFAVERDRLQKELSHMSQHDSLTGLPNRGFAISFLAETIREFTERKTPFAIMLADLDGFKAVNDTLGHDVGDQVLMELSNRFQNLLQGRDIVGRLGGDEFLFVLPECDTTDDCERYAQKILESCQSSFAVPNNEFRISLSVGLARFPKDGTVARNLVRAADEAMYEAKNSGKNQFFWAVTEGVTSNTKSG
ncbi:GGDEF domain-containing protein [Sedimentitalea sp. CY04]|uniref:GGDEF domain-containing protein n=1 Tax=Parasedimentitalea denitrificans TaxID=2211118 RepID=A0ABX0WCW4_9RHOB|nr:diguanylate cyclase [Sedimentitalea sp. CY04]NIZ63487.1 GGDEF domain-containing protein [Sedimentitalea sp. CY04]